MKKSILTAALICMLAFSGCGNSSNSTATDNQAEQTAEEAKAPDLSGNWKQINSDSETSYQSATIEGETIEIYWVDEEGETKSLYWAGTFIAPETTDDTLGTKVH